MTGLEPTILKSQVQRKTKSSRKYAQTLQKYEYIIKMPAIIDATVNIKKRDTMHKTRTRTVHSSMRYACNYNSINYYTSNDNRVLGQMATQDQNSQILFT